MPGKVIVAGYPLFTHTDFEEIVIRQLRGMGPWNARGDVECNEGLLRALREAGPLREAIARAVIGLLTHPDPVLRTGAVTLLDEVAVELGADALADLLERRPELFFGVAPEGFVMHHNDLSWPMLLQLGRLAPPGHEGACRLLREATGRPRGTLVVDNLARIDPDWLVAHPEVIPPDWIAAILELLPTDSHRDAMKLSLAGLKT